MEWKHPYPLAVSRATMMPSAYTPPPGAVRQTGPPLSPSYEEKEAQQAGNPRQEISV